MSTLHEDAQTIGIAELAKILRRSEHTVRCDVTRRPETLPPRLSIPGTKRVVWLMRDVVAWIDQHSTRTQHKLK
jgi:predicted DNA-binding transcriptional regulator AlpA